MTSLKTARRTWRNDLDDYIAHMVNIGRPLRELKVTSYQYEKLMEQTGGRPFYQGLPLIIFDDK